MLLKFLTGIRAKIKKTKNKRGAHNIVDPKWQERAPGSGNQHTGGRTDSDGCVQTYRETQNTALFSMKSTHIYRRLNLKGIQSCFIAVWHHQISVCPFKNFSAKLSAISESVPLHHVPLHSASVPPPTWAAELVCVSVPGWTAEGWTAGLREGMFSAVSPRSVPAGWAPPTTLCTKSPSSCSQTCWRHRRGRTYSQPEGENRCRNKVALH